MPVVTITNTDLIFITLNIDGVNSIIKKTWCIATTTGNYLILNWFNEIDSRRYNYEQTILESDVTAPVHTDINDLYATVTQWLTNSGGGGGFSTTIWSKLTATGAINGVNTGFVITDAFTGDIDVVSNGISLKLADANGYTQTGNSITLINAPDALDIWGNKPIP